MNRDDILRIFSDVDSLKKQQQEMEVEQLKLLRGLQKLESHELADISNKLKSIDKKIDEFDEFSESAKRVLSANAAGAADASDEKYTIVVAEMQKLKNQVRGFGGSVVELLNVNRFEYRCLFHIFTIIVSKAAQR